MFAFQENPTKHSPAWQGEPEDHSLAVKAFKISSFKFSFSKPAIQKHQPECGMRDCPCSFPKIVTAGLACDLERMLEKVLSSKVWRAKARSKFSFISLCSKTTENMCSPLQPLQCSSPDVKKQLHSDSCKLTHPYQTLTPCLRSHLPAAASTIESCSQE